MGKKIYFPMLQEKFEERIAEPVPDGWDDEEEETESAMDTVQQPPRQEKAPATPGKAATPGAELSLDDLMKQMGD
ncbi:MAG: hypothetical protein SPL62_04360 [Selenomonas sp.]|nr:hypothetical protein [Selenomonas sp.]